MKSIQKTVKYNVTLYKQHSFIIYTTYTRKCIVELIIIPKKYIIMHINLLKKYSSDTNNTYDVRYIKIIFQSI